MITLSFYMSVSVLNLFTWFISEILFFLLNRTLLAIFFCFENLTITNKCCPYKNLNSTYKYKNKNNNIICTFIYVLQYCNTIFNNTRTICLQHTDISLTFYKHTYTFALTHILLYIELVVVFLHRHALKFYFIFAIGVVVVICNQQLYKICRLNSILQLN